MKRCDGVYCLAPLAAVVLVVTPVEAQNPFDHLPNPWGSFSDRFFDRHHRFFPTPGSSGLATAQVGIQGSMDTLIIT